MNTTLLALTKQLQARQDSALANSSLSVRLGQVRDDTAMAKKRWRIMKSVVAAIIAGSGVDWARNNDLRNLVLDEENEAD